MGDGAMARAPAGMGFGVHSVETVTASASIELKLGGPAQPLPAIQPAAQPAPHTGGQGWSAIVLGRSLSRKELVDSWQQRLSGLASCAAPGRCECREGWSGAACAVPACPHSCSGHGR